VDGNERLHGARQALAGAEALLASGEFRGCVSRCYYAVYQAMWAAVGNPEKKPRWEHFGLMSTFVRGKWLNSMMSMQGPGLLEGQRFALRRLYDLRLGADYRLDNVTYKDAEWAVQTVREILGIVDQQES
jgi:uncharacterized protein (UPF0332 family)